MVRWGVLLLLCAAWQSGIAQQVPAVASSAQAGVIDLLHSKDQALLDAIAPGNAGAWDAMLAPDAMYVDENGQTMARADFLKQLTPLPAGASGTIKIKSYTASVHGDVATVIHTDDEHENYHGQQLHAEYLTTETWQKAGTDWKLLLVHTYALLHDPPSVSLPVRYLDEYVGKYKAGDLVYSITRKGDHLMGSREGRPPTELRAEVRDVFFIAGQPRTRKIFQRNGKGKITGFVDRREGIDLVWRKSE